jgi:hypothetical protein
VAISAVQDGREGERIFFPSDRASFQRIFSASTDHASAKLWLSFPNMAQERRRDGCPSSDRFEW